MAHDYQCFLVVTLTASQKQEYLERIRDNQRRSRARRKEYQEDLETRLRNYELHGSQPSSEIQEAARRVIDENKKLRSLLAQYGIEDDTVAAYLQSATPCGNPRRVDPVQTVEPRQAFDTTYFNSNIGIPVNSMMGGVGSVDRSTAFYTFNLGVYPPADSTQLDLAPSRNNERSGLTGPPLDSWRYNK